MSLDKSALFLIRATRAKAKELRCSYVSTDCALLAVLDIRNCRVYKALEASRVDIQQLGVRLRLGLQTQEKRKPGRPPLTVRLERAIKEGAVQEANARGAQKISAEDIVLAFLRDNIATATVMVSNWVSTDELAGQLYAH